MPQLRTLDEEKLKRNVLISHLVPRYFAVFTTSQILYFPSFQLLDALRLSAESDHSLSELFYGEDSRLWGYPPTADQFNYRAEVCAAALVSILSHVQSDERIRERLLHLFNMVGSTMAQTR